MLCPGIRTGGTEVLRFPAELTAIRTTMTIVGSYGADSNGAMFLSGDTLRLAGEVDLPETKWYSVEFNYLVN